MEYLVVVDPEDLMAKTSPLLVKNKKRFLDYAPPAVTVCTCERLLLLLQIVLGRAPVAFQVCECLRSLANVLGDVAGSVPDMADAPNVYYRCLDQFLHGRTDPRLRQVRRAKKHMQVRLALLRFFEDRQIFNRAFREFSTCALHEDTESVAQLASALARALAVLRVDGER